MGYCSSRYRRIESKKIDDFNLITQGLGRLCFKWDKKNTGTGIGLEEKIVI